MGSGLEKSEDDWMDCSNNSRFDAFNIAVVVGSLGRFVALCVEVC